MLFQVTRPDGQVMMSTDSPECIPYYQVRSIADAGYILKLGGKKVTPITIERYEKTLEVEEAKSTKPKVWCVELQKEFNTQSEAAKYLGIDPAQVSDSIKTGRKRSGYTFTYIEV